MMLLTNLAAAASLLLPTVPEAIAPQLAPANGANSVLQFGVDRVGGPGHSSDRVEANSTDFFNITFKGGELARVFVEGDGDTDLDLYVYDSEGNLMDSDVHTSDVCLARWTPSRTQTFRIEVRNLGSVWNAYEITTN
ncbi:MAG: hypothetical protein AAF196_14785 [Planctomycetota bacterium]